MPLFFKNTKKKNLFRNLAGLALSQLISPAGHGILGLAGHHGLGSQATLALPTPGFTALVGLPDLAGIPHLPALPADPASTSRT